MIHWHLFIGHCVMVLIAYNWGIRTGHRERDKELAQTAARAAIREAEGLPVIGNPMRDALSEIDGKEAK